MKIRSFMLSTILLMSASVHVMSENSQKIAEENFSGSRVSFSEKSTAINTTLSISGPDGFFVSRALKNGVPTVDLYDGGTPSNGRYRYHITASISNETNNQPTRKSLNNGRDPQAPKAIDSISQSGYFTVEQGQIKKFEDTLDVNTTQSR